MAAYTNEYSRLPNQIYERHNFKDADDSIAPLIEQIKTLQRQGMYDKINELVKSKENLSRYVFGAEHINAIDEEIRNLEIFALEKKTSTHYADVEPDNAVFNDVWIGD